MLYISKPVQIEAVQWTGENTDEIKQFATSDENVSFQGGNTLFVNTNHGLTVAEVGDYIIKSSKGEFYPCKPDVFAEKYERSIFDDVDK